MKTQLKTLRIEALRSGKYAQAKGELKTAEGFCCLGVLCDVALNHNMLPKGYEAVVKNDEIELHNTEEFDGRGRPG